MADPAGGSYYIESLTDSLAREAWKLFQQVEAAGGYARRLRPAPSRAPWKQPRQAREKAVVVAPPHPGGRQQLSRPEREDHGGDHAGRRCGLSAFRLAEAVRKNPPAHRSATPPGPAASRGPAAHSAATSKCAWRAPISASTSSAAPASTIVESDEYAGTGADLIVLCSSDPEYLALAQEVCPAVSVPVIVAGNPKDQIEALKAAGVAGFIHVQSDAVQTLTEWQNRLGMEA